MEKRVFFKWEAFCSVLLILVLYVTSAGLASMDFVFVREWGYKDPTPTYPNPSRDSQGFRGPTGIAISPDESIVYVADFSNSRIHKYDRDGNFLGMLTECPDINPATQEYCRAAGKANCPISLAVDPSGAYVYVIDAKDYRVQKFDSAGHYLLGWGVEENSRWLFKDPAGVAVDAAGDVYVTDIFQSVVYKFDPNGNFKTMWISKFGSGDSYRPTGIATAPSGIYITDFLNDYVSKFSFTGVLRTTWGSGHDGNANGEFIYPAALAVDSLGNIFVADTYNDRIQSFSGTWESYNCSSQGGLNKPFGIAVDSSGNVYVADTYKHRILKYKYTLKN